MTRANKIFPSTSALLGVGASILYTCPSGTVAKPFKMTLTNTTGTGRTVTVYLVRSGDSPATKNMLVNALSVPATNTVQCLDIVGQTLLPGDTIQALCDAATAVAPTGSLDEFILS